MPFVSFVDDWLLPIGAPDFHGSLIEGLLRSAMRRDSHLTLEIFMTRRIFTLIGLAISLGLLGSAAAQPAKQLPASVRVLLP